MGPIILVLVVLAGGLAAANLGRESGRPDLDWSLIRTPPREVVLEGPRHASIVETITAAGSVEPVEEAAIAPQIIGRVVAVLVDDGDAVKAGDLLVKLDEAEARARLDSAIARIERLAAAIDRADADVEKANRDLIRTEQLARRGASTPTELADMRSERTRSMAALDIARNELAESEAMRRTSQQELEYTEIRAPIDGVVVGRDVEVGEVVIAGTTNLPGSTLMSVANLGRMRVRADVDETDVPLVQPGQPARVYLQSDLLTAIPGVVDRVAPKGELVEEVVTFKTLIGVDSGAGVALRPGMTATVEVEVRRADDAPSVPVQAVVHRRLKDLPGSTSVREWLDRHPTAPGERVREVEARYVTVVFVAEGGKARARPVDVGLSDERRVEITAGLAPSDRVIVGPFRALDELKDGDAVVESKDDTTPAP